MKKDKEEEEGHKEEFWKKVLWKTTWAQSLQRSRALLNAVAYIYLGCWSDE